MQRTVMAALAMLSLGALPARAAEIKVLSTTLMNSIIWTAGPAFERATGHKLSVTFDTTNILVGASRTARVPMSQS